MVTLQYFNGTEWVFVEDWQNEQLAWWSLGGDNINYRTIDENGNVLTDKSLSKETIQSKITEVKEEFKNSNNKFKNFKCQ